MMNAKPGLFHVHEATSSLVYRPCHPLVRFIIILEDDVALNSSVKYLLKCWSVPKFERRLSSLRSHKEQEQEEEIKKVGNLLQTNR